MQVPHSPNVGRAEMLDMRTGDCVVSADSELNFTNEGNKICIKDKMSSIRHCCERMHFVRNNKRVEGGTFCDVFIIASVEK